MSLRASEGAQQSEAPPRIMNIKEFIKNLIRPPFTLDKVLTYMGGVSVAAIAVFLVWFNDNGFEVIKNNKADAAKFGEPSSLTGENCVNNKKRPIAVMLAADPITRPLSGISEADVVFEMPVTPNGIPRFMALFQCSDPKEIGSIRSAREDFLPLVGAFGAIYAHWGGEHDALAKLNSGILDNIDGMKYEGSVYYRKDTVPRPHNGFTTLSNVTEQSEKLNYQFVDTFKGYPRIKDDTSSKNLATLTSTITVPYPEPYNVEWKYDDSSATYKRSRGGTPEIDKNTGQQVAASVIVVLETTSHDLNKDYITVSTTGTGRIVVYQDGSYVVGSWRKDTSTLDGKLFFLDQDGKEVELKTGKMWVEILARKQ